MPRRSAGAQGMAQATPKDTHAHILRHILLSPCMCWLTKALLATTDTREIARGPRLAMRPRGGVPVPRPDRRSTMQDRGITGDITHFVFSLSCYPQRISDVPSYPSAPRDAACHGSTGPHRKVSATQLIHIPLSEVAWRTPVFSATPFLRPKKPRNDMHNCHKRPHIACYHL